MFVHLPHRHPIRRAAEARTIDTGDTPTEKATEVNAEAWGLLAERSRSLVHHASTLMGVLTQPVLDDVASLRAAAQAAEAVRAQDEALAAAPELAAHRRVLQRFDAALAAWRACVEAHGALRQRHHTALLQQATQALTSCLHVESLATSESARSEVCCRELAPRMDSAAP